MNNLKVTRNKKTKILVVGDVHGDTGLVKKMAKKAEEEKVDLVILTGDLTLAEQSTKNLIGPFLKVKKQVLLLHGNHESIATTDFLTELYGPSTKNLHGYSIQKNDIGIFGAGGADIGPDTINESEIFKILKKGNDEVKNMKKRVMVTHMHAEGTDSEFSGWPGSSGIRKAIEKLQPDLFIHSHIHEAEGLEEKIGKTIIINVGRKGRIIEL
ncbi:MAG: metallophosphoesterase [Nanoarchaeota archaeon]